VFDRVTGKPIWPIEERPVAQSDVPGEKSAKTQPFPTKPPAYGRNYIKIPDDLIDFTPEMRADAIDRMKSYRVEGMFTPPVVGDPKHWLGGINLGNASGGTNWPGAGFDPETGVAYAQAAQSFVTPISLRTPPEGFSDIRYVSGRNDQTFRVAEGPGYGSAADFPTAPRGARGRGAETAAAATPGGRGATPPAGGGGGGGGLQVQGLPIVKPPYGVISAIDVNKGDLKWQVPYGETPDNIRNSPALKGMNIGNTGMNGSVGVLITKSLVILGDSQITSVTHPRGAMIRAYDKNTGKEVGAVLMPAPVSGSPMTYEWQGRQYIIIAVSGGTYTGEYIAFALPESEEGATQAQR
jgi:quinoprotein glucose dehydrogenase